MDKKIVKTEEDLLNLAAFGGVDVIEAAAQFEDEPDDKVQEFTDSENVNWEDIPAEEKATPEDLDYMEATAEGLADGMSYSINKRVENAMKSGAAEELVNVRRAMGITDKEMEAFKHA